VVRRCRASLENDRGVVSIRHGTARRIDVEDPAAVR
jgi:hypothetical protein